MIFLNIYNYKIFIESSHPQIDHRLNLEFDYFLSPIEDNFQLKIKYNLQDTLASDLIPKNLKPTFQRSNSITYDSNGIRWNNYYGKVISKFIAMESYCEFYGTDLDKLYEVIYLFILSRSGKFLDLNGLHKIHAFAFSKGNKAIVCMQPMRGGKSTLLTEILKEKDVSVISDDTPLFNLSGEILPFPLRMSLENLPRHLNLNQSDYFVLKREFFKSKYSIAIKSFNRPICPKANNYILIEAKRSTYENPILIRNSFLKKWQSLMVHLVIGFGLPIIFEYFWEAGITDFFRKSKIFLSRLYLATKLSLSKESYTLYLSEDSTKNAALILDLMK